MTVCSVEEELTKLVSERDIRKNVNKQENTQETEENKFKQEEMAKAEEEEVTVDS